MTDTRSSNEWLATDPAGFALRRAISGKEKPVKARYGDPGGGLYSSARDMLKWLRYSIGLLGSPTLPALDHLLYEDAANERAIDPGRTIGLVWNILDAKGVKGVKCVSKNGDGQGFHASVVFVQGERPARGAFVLVNNDPTTSYRKMASDLLNALPTKTGADAPVCPQAAG